LSNCIQALFGTAGFEFKFDEKNRNRTKRLEVILHPAFGSDTTFDNGFGQIPKSKVEYSDKTIKDLRANFDFVCGMKSWLALTGDRNRDLASSVSCSIGGPYCTSIISISCTMDLKSAVGMRERWSSKVLISRILRPASSPTNDAMDTYLTLEKLTSMRSSLKGSLNPVSFRKSKDSGRTGQYLLQQAQIEIMLFHYMKESDFSGNMIRDRRGQQCSESIGGLYY
jgi:hypothetical protein